MTLPTAYLAPISWYRAFLHADKAEAEVLESFPKQTLRNRCMIAGTNGVQTLSIPVEHCESKQLTRDVRIAYREPWQHRHWMALVSAYRHTPFFDYMADDFAPFYEKRTTFLVDFNMALHGVVCKWLQTDKTLALGSKWSGDKNLDRYFEQQSPLPPYYQIFAAKTGFAENLSIIDLIANIGTEAGEYLSKA